MKKALLAAVLFVAGAFAANAQGYNRAALSYNHDNLSYNKEMGDFGVGLNGFGLNYIHGFGVAENMFVEVGGNFNFNFGSDSESVEGYKFETKYQNINLQVPVNYVYRFNVADGVSIDPYVGLNFKLHLTAKTKFEETEDGETEKSDWVSAFDEDKVGKDNTWNRFQMGWHVGAGLNYDRYYLGVQFGTDFLPIYKQDKAKINTSSLKISLGYTF